MLTWRGLRAAAFALAGFLCALALVEAALPFDYDPVLHGKFEYFKAHKDEYTTVAIGASRIYREIVPSRLDAAFQAAGVESHSFNMGLAGMEVLEAHYVLERISELHPRKLKYLLIGTDLSPGYFEDWEINPVNTRNIYWRTPAETARDIVNHVASAPSLRAAAPMVYRALVLCAYRVTNRGRLANFLTAALDGHRASFDDQRLADWRGYFPLELDHYGFFVDERKKFLADPGYFDRVLAWEPSTFQPPPPPYPPQYAGMQAILRLARRNGWKVVFIRSLLEPPEYPTGCETRQADCAAIGFEDRRKYADLYRYSRFYDYFHLNRDAAPEYTGLVAARILALNGLVERP